MSEIFARMTLELAAVRWLPNRSLVPGAKKDQPELLQYFVEHRDITLSRGHLLRNVWGYRDTPVTRTVDVHVHRLRQKIEADPTRPRVLVSVQGVGYRFENGVARGKQVLDATGGMSQPSQQSRAGSRNAPRQRPAPDPRNSPM